MIERDESNIPSNEDTSKESNPEEREFEVGLRPQSFSEFVGQDNIKENLSIDELFPCPAGSCFCHML